MHQHSPTPAERLRDAFWTLTAGRMLERSDLTGKALRTLVKSNPDDALAVVTDELVAAFHAWGRERAGNPACMASELAGASFDPKPPEPAMDLLGLVARVLRSADPTRDSSTEHDVCQPWGPDVGPPSVRRLEGARRLLDETSKLLPIFRPEGSILQLNVVSAGAFLLDFVVRERAGGDMQRIESILGAHADLARSVGPGHDLP